MKMHYVIRFVAVYIILAVTQLFAGKALYMDGENDFLRLFETIVHDSPFTIEAWAVMYGPGGGVYEENTLFEQRSLNTVMGGSAVVFHAKNDSVDDATAFVVRDGESSQSSARHQRQPYNVWTHYAGVVDGEFVYLYLDGELVDEQPNSQSGTFDIDIDHISIGRHSYLDLVAGYFNGMIDEMRIWNCARSKEEIIAGMHTTVDLDDQGTASKLLAYWRFDEFYEFWKNGEQYIGVKDLSGNEHHGALMDDATLGGEGPIAVTVSAFTARATEQGNMLEWNVDNAIHYAGFNIFRSENEETDYTKINSTMIMASDGFCDMTGEYEYLDNVNGQYYYKLQVVDVDGDTQLFGPCCAPSTAVCSDNQALPEAFELQQNYPNPFNPNTNITFCLPVKGRVKLNVFDQSGRQVKSLVDSQMPRGIHWVYWDGTMDDGSTVAAGVYFYTLIASPEHDASIRIIKKMTFLK